MQFADEFAKQLDIVIVTPPQAYIEQPIVFL
jgi:hypothetical protein